MGLDKFGQSLLGQCHLLWRELLIRLLPPGEFLLSKNAQRVESVKHVLALHPVESGYSGVQLLQHSGIGLDIR